MVTEVKAGPCQPFMMQMDEAVKKLQEGMAQLLEQNKTMNDKIDKLQAENIQLKRNAENVEERVKTNIEKLNKMNEEGQTFIQDMQVVKDELIKDGLKDFDSIKWFYETKDFIELCGSRTGLGGFGITVKEEPAEGTLQTPFDVVGREERIDVSFGIDGDYSAKALRRFIERFKVVKGLNMSARLTGWDGEQYRANKNLKLALQAASR